MAAAENPERLDKEFLRLWISERCDPYNESIPDIPADTLMAFSGKYVTLFEKVTGQEFEKPSSNFTSSTAFIASSTSIVLPGLP